MLPLWWCDCDHDGLLAWEPNDSFSLCPDSLDDILSVFQVLRQAARSAQNEDVSPRSNDCRDGLLVDMTIHHDIEL